MGAVAAVRVLLMITQHPPCLPAPPFPPLFASLRAILAMSFWLLLLMVT
jgi:hypothetical protein